MAVFRGCLAWFSSSVPSLIKDKWVQNGGEVVVDPAQARFIFSDDPEAPDTIGFFKDEEDIINVFTSEFISKCLEAQQLVNGGPFILSPAYTEPQTRITYTELQQEEETQEEETQPPVLNGTAEVHAPSQPKPTLHPSASPSGIKWLHSLAPFPPPSSLVDFEPGKFDFSVSVRTQSRAPPAQDTTTTAKATTTPSKGTTPPVPASRKRQREDKQEPAETEQATREQAQSQATSTTGSRNPLTLKRQRRKT